MNVYVMVDIEGISGIYTREQVLPSESRFGEGRRYMTQDVNCCVEGLKAAGVDKVYVRDCHGGSYAFCWDDLTSEADYYICGHMPEKRFLGMEDCDALILLGYHAMAGTKGAVLEHTFSSKSIQNMYINEQKVGEIAIDAAIAGELGIPVIMVSGDDKTCQEAEQFLPGVTTACVKQGMSTYGAMLLPQKKAHDLIRAKAMEAVAKAKEQKPFTFAKPLNCRVEVMERTLIQNSIQAPFVDIIDGRSYRVTGENMEEVLFRSMSVR